MSPKTIPSADRPIVARLERPMEGVASGCGVLDTTCCIWPNPAILEMRFMSLLIYPPCWPDNKGKPRQQEFRAAPRSRVTAPSPPGSPPQCTKRQEAPRSAPRRIRCARLIPRLLTTELVPFSLEGVLILGRLFGQTPGFERNPRGIA